MDRRGFITGAVALTALANFDVSRAAANSIITPARSSALSSEVWSWGALDTARAILRRDVSCREVTEAALRRIEAVNHKINAVVDIFPDESLAAADIADAQLREGIRPGPLFGVPITIKDNTDQKGRRTVNGQANSARDPAIADSPVVQNLRTSGSIIVGRTNTPCLSSRWDTDNQVYGRTHNPYSPSRTTGGSSGGAAAALAVGIGALAHGNDIGGSIRYPAFCCGVTGLRPSMGRTPMFNATAASRSFCNQMFNVEGMLARDVRDLAHSLSSLSVGSVQDPLWCGTPIGGADMSRRRKIGLVTGAAGLSVAREISNTITQAGQRLSERGYAVEVVNPPLSTPTEL